MSRSVRPANESPTIALSKDLPLRCSNRSDKPPPHLGVRSGATSTNIPAFRVERSRPAIALGGVPTRPGSPMARTPTFLPTVSTRRQKRTPRPTPNVRPAPSQCTRRSTQPPEPPCIPQKRKSLPATPPRASPSATGARLKIHSARDSPLHSALCAAVPKNRKTPPQSKSVKRQPSARSVRSGSESAMDKEDRKQLPPADRIRARQSANTKGCRNAPKFQATHNASRRAPANSR